MSSLQERLALIYNAWKTRIDISESEGAKLSPPLLMSVPDGYESAERRILFCGQETYGWGWTADYRKQYPRYERDFPFKDVCSLADFMRNEDGVEALCWAYREFDFSSKQPINHRSLFWQAFREVQGWPGASLIWGNLSRCDYLGHSILAAPTALIDELAELQRELLTEEICLLKPDVCLFFSGPYYDVLLSTIFPDIVYEPVVTANVRQLAKLSHPNLPAMSFRTYHPGYLNRAGLWEFLNRIRDCAIA